jgi:hypothetical protein
VDITRACLGRIEVLEPGIRALDNVLRRRNRGHYGRRRRPEREELQVGREKDVNLQ